MTLVAWGPGMGRVSPDGDWLAYLKHDGQMYQMYLYDRQADELSCVSCPGDASLEPTITNTGLEYFKGFRPRFLSDDGQLFFSSTGALVPRTPMVSRMCMSLTGQTKTLSLLSSGKGSEPSDVRRRESQRRRCFRRYSPAAGGV